jgi:hypothetical protein
MGRACFGGSLPTPVGSSGVSGSPESDRGNSYPSFEFGSDLAACRARSLISFPKSIPGHGVIGFDKDR